MLIGYPALELVEPAVHYSLTDGLHRVVAESLAIHNEPTESGPYSLYAGALGSKDHIGEEVGLPKHSLVDELRAELPAANFPVGEPLYAGMRHVEEQFRKGFHSIRY